MTASDADRQLGDDELAAAEPTLVSAAAVGAVVDLRVGDARLDLPAQWST